MLRPRFILLLGTCLSVSACVLPFGGATGLEVTWSLREANAVDGADARRLRTCGGAGIARVAVDLVDDADPSRRGLFTYPCAAGNPPPRTRATETPEIFLDLRAGSYTLVATATDDADAALAARTATAEIEAHAITALDLELARPTRPISLELAGACEQLTATLRYADPEADLFLDDSGAAPAVYRGALESDRGLRLGGHPQPCAGLAGLHRVADVDPGRYILDLVVDGRACSWPVLVEDSPEELVVDLENPACGG